MTSNPWFRLYAEFATDPVVQSLAFEDQRHFVVLMCLKCNGVLDRNIDTRARNRIILRGLGLDAATAEEAKRRLMEVGLVEKNWQIPAWNERQFVSDNSTPRVRKYRKTNETGNVSPPLRERFGNGPDTDTEQKDISPNGSSASRGPVNGASVFFEDIKTVLQHLGERTGIGYRWKNPSGKPTAHAECVRKVLKKGYTVEDCTRVIDSRTELWANDEKMAPYLRPSTLFRISNFENYLDGI